MIRCKCGHWYNTSVKCPECDTVAKERDTNPAKYKKNKKVKK